MFAWYTYILCQFFEGFELGSGPFWVSSLFSHHFSDQQVTLVLISLLTLIWFHKLAEWILCVSKNTIATKRISCCCLVYVLPLAFFFSWLVVPRLLHLFSPRILCYIVDNLICPTVLVIVLYTYMFYPKVFWNLFYLLLCIRNCAQLFLILLAHGIKVLHDFESAPCQSLWIVI